MSQPIGSIENTAVAAIKDGDCSFELRVDACRVLLGGEFAGNIELDLACPADVTARVLDCLRVQVPGEEPSEMALGNGVYAPGVHLVFWADWSPGLQELPEHVILLWGDTQIASVAPKLEDSVPIDEVVTYTEPSDILSTLPAATSNLVLLAANREKSWFLLAALLVVASALVGSSFPGLELPDPMLNWVLGGVLLTAGLGVGFFLGHVPYEQVWLDRDRRRVLVTAGRTGSPESKLADAPGRSLDEFNHVRVYMRWRISQDTEGSDQEVWFVALEGHIPFASADGTVQLHQDGMPVGNYGSDITARKVAAQVGLHTGLKILDTGHDKTA